MVLFLSLPSSLFLSKTKESSFSEETLIDYSIFIHEGGLSNNEAIGEKEILEKKKQADIDSAVEPRRGETLEKKFKSSKKASSVNPNSMTFSSPAEEVEKTPRFSGVYTPGED